MPNLRGGPMDGHMLKPEEATGVDVTIQERPGLNVALPIGKLIPMTSRRDPTATEGRRGTYVVGNDGDYHWRGWKKP